MKLQRYASLMILFALMLTPSICPAQDENIRSAVLKREIDTMRDLMEKSASTEEYNVMSNRMALAEAELKTLQSEMDFAQNEIHLNSISRNYKQIRLQKAIEMIDARRNVHVERRDSIAEQIRNKRDEHKRLTVELTVLSKSDSDAENTIADARRGIIQQELDKLDSEIKALSLKRDTEELYIEIADDIKRIENTTLNPELIPKTSIRSLITAKRAVHTEEKIKEQYGELVSRLRDRKAEISRATAISKDQHDSSDAEISILKKRLDLEKTTLRNCKKSEKESQSLRCQRIKSFLIQTESRKKSLRGKIENQKKQSLAAEESLMLAEKALNMITLHEELLKHDFKEHIYLFCRNILYPVSAVILIFLFSILIKLSILPIFYRRDGLFVARRLSNYLTALLIILVLSVSFMEDLKAVAAILGLAGAAIIIALSDLCAAFAGWFVIVSSRKLRVGDRVEINGHRGDVIDIQLLRTTLIELNNWLGVDEPTGRIIAVPNNFIFKSAVFNYSHIHPYIWGNIDITVTFESPAAKAREILMRVLNEQTVEEFEAARKGATDLVKYYGADHLHYYEPRIHSVIADCGIKFTLFYVCHYKKFAGTRDKISEQIINAFEANKDIEFAYPTERHIPTPPPAG